MPRRRFTERDVLEVLWHCGILVPCHRCREPLVPDTQIEREHLIEIAIGGADEPKNCAYSHKACHAIVTNGTPATTAGSSKQRIAKVRRLSSPKPKMKRAWPAGRKIASRPFQKRKKP